MDLSFISNIFLYAIYCVYAFILFYYTSFHHSPNPLLSLSSSLSIFNVYLHAKCWIKISLNFILYHINLDFSLFYLSIFRFSLARILLLVVVLYGHVKLLHFPETFFFFEFDFVFFVWIRNCLYMRRTCAIYIRWRNVKKTYAVSGERVRWMCSFKQSNENQNWYDSMEYYVF